MTRRTRSRVASGIPAVSLITPESVWIDTPAAVAQAAIVVVGGVFRLQEWSTHVVVAWVSRAVKAVLDSPVGSTLYASGVTPDPFRRDAT